MVEKVGPGQPGLGVQDGVESEEWCVQMDREFREGTEDRRVSKGGTPDRESSEKTRKSRVLDPDKPLSRVESEREE